LCRNIIEAVLDIIANSSNDAKKRQQAFLASLPGKALVPKDLT
jgi:hypothetical protein